MTPEEVKTLAVVRSGVKPEYIKDVTILSRVEPRHMTLKRDGLVVSIGLTNEDIDPSDMFIEVYENPLEVVILPMI